MDQEAVSEKIARLDDVLSTTPKGQPVQMGTAFYGACEDRGLVATDVTPKDANPSYRGVRRIVVIKALPEWEFRIGPPFVEAPDA